MFMAPDFKNKTKKLESLNRVRVSRSSTAHAWFLESPRELGRRPALAHPTAPGGGGEPLAGVSKAPGRVLRTSGRGRRLPRSPRLLPVSGHLSPDQSRARRTVGRVALGPAGKAAQRPVDSVARGPRTVPCPNSPWCLLSRPASSVWEETTASREVKDSALVGRVWRACEAPLCLQRRTRFAVVLVLQEGGQVALLWSGHRSLTTLPLPTVVPTSPCVSSHGLSGQQCSRAAWPARAPLLSQNWRCPGLTMTAEGPGWRGSRGQSGGRVQTGRRGGGAQHQGRLRTPGHLLDGVVAPAMSVPLRRPPAEEGAVPGACAGAGLCWAISGRLTRAGRAGRAGRGPTAPKAGRCNLSRASRVGAEARAGSGARWLTRVAREAPSRAQTA